MMKHKVSFLAILLIAILLPKMARAYDFTSVAPSGQTLYYSIGTSSNGEKYAYVTYPHATAMTTADVWAGFTKPTGNLIIPNTVTYNGEEYVVRNVYVAFFGCDGLTSVTLPDSLWGIDFYAFCGCEGLTSVVIPDNVWLIGDGAFAGCGMLASVTIPNSVRTIGKKAFYKCAMLDSITIPDGVISIDSSAFRECSRLTSVMIGNSVTSIGEYAFYKDSRLTLLHFNAENCADFPSTYVFYDCPIVTLHIGNSVRRIPAHFMAGKDRLTSVTIPDSVTYIGDGVFRNCRGLTSVTLPSSVTRISSGVFYGCTGLTSVAIPNSVTQIGSNAFRGCTGLTPVTIPNSVTQIDSNAFRGCTGLTSVTIGSGVTSIGENAFAGGDHIIQMTCLASVPPTVANVNAFDDVFRGIPLYVPAASLSSYQIAYAWREFTNIIAMSAYTVTAVAADPTMGTVTGGGNYAEGDVAILAAMPNNGYHFVRWNDGSTDNPRTVTVTGDVTYTATFAADTVAGIGEAAAINVRIYQSGGQLVVEGTEGQPVVLYDMTGRVLGKAEEGVGATGIAGAHRFDVPASGTYLVRIGNHPARKVVVIR